MSVEYFQNHQRRTRWPWSAYHTSLARIVKLALEEGAGPQRGLVVGCGLEPFCPFTRDNITYYGCDLDESAIVECKRLYPAMENRLAVCPSPYELPSAGEFAQPFDAVIAKEVIEHLSEPERWARSLVARVRPGGRLVLTTPNYGFPSTLGTLERTVLEVVARWDGYSRAHIHPSRFTEKRLALLDLGSSMRLDRVERAFLAWALVGVWKREVSQS